MRFFRYLLRLRIYSKCVGPAAFADLLDARRDDVLRDFVDRTSAAIPGARDRSRQFVEDHLRSVLAEMANFLRSEGREAYRHSTWLADTHGRQRAGGETYSVADVRREYDILDGTVRGLVAPGRELSARAQDLYARIFRVSLSHATETFVRNSTSELLEHRAAQARSESELARAQAERDLAKDLHAWLFEIINRIPKPVFLLNRDAQSVWFTNDAAKKMLALDYERDRAAALADGRIVATTPDGRVLSPDEIPSSRALRGESFRGEEVIITTPFARHHVRVSAEQLAAAYGQPASSVVLIQDISALKATEDDLRESRDDAERANTAKSAFLANMSHEIRSPLGAIMGFSELLRSGDFTPSEVSEFVAVIDRNSRHVLRIIDDILDLSKVEAGKMLIEHIEFSLPELLADFSSLMGMRAREKGIDLELSLSTAIPECIFSDPTRLRQVLTNVVGNAVKFTEKGRVRIEVSFAAGKLEFAVADTGIGLSMTEAGRLFEAFNQADATTTRKFGGTGLGLVLTRKLCEALGGGFDLRQSEPGVGSTFVAHVAVDVPGRVKMIEDSVLAYSTSRAVEARKAGGLAGLRILVVEDSPDNQILFQLLLTKAGASVRIARDGIEGVDAALSETFDVVLMDVQMPRMDGHEAVRRLRGKGYRVPIIALTAHAMVEERTRAAASGFSEYVSKPVDREQLFAKILASAGRRSIEP